jgi:YggT family protein
MTDIVYTSTHAWYYPTHFIVTLVNVVFGVVEFIIGVQIVLELLGANSGAPFVAWLYSMSSNFVAPFAGAFASWNLGGGYILDLSAIFAMICYAIIGWIVIRLLSLLFSTLSRVQI